LNSQSNKLLFPITGMLIGMTFGIFLGLAAIWYFEVHTLLNQVCVVGSSFMIFQLFGATVGSTIGKPPQ